MSKNIMENLIAAIKAALPDNVKMSYYLMDILSLGREAVYRRIRGEITFSLEELILISRNLNISLDRIINTESVEKYGVFDTEMLIKGTSISHLMENLQTILERNIDLYRAVRKSTNAQISIVANVVPIQFLLDYKNLLKIPSYKWIYQTQQMKRMVLFSEYRISEEIINLTNEFAKEVNSINSDFILDWNTFASIVEDIIYLTKLNLITKDEVLILKEELLDLINSLEEKAARGYFTPTSKIQIYISNIYIDSTYSLLEWNQNQIIYYRLYGLSHINTADETIDKVHKAWINSLKRSSILIAQSADLVRIEYFNKQRELIQKL